MARSARGIRRALPLVAVVALVATGCAGAQPPGTAAGGAPASVNLSLDWTPNPDHAGLYYAQQHGFFQRAGLRVTMKAPSDPSAPIKLVGLDKVDLAISYQPDLFLASPKRPPVKAVAALVPVPLNSLIALGGSGVTGPAALRGRSVGITGIPTDDAILSTLLRDGGVPRGEVRTVSVGFNLVTSLLSRKVDAILGGYRNVEGIQIQQETGRQPVVLPVDRLGVPSYDELVVVANSRRLDSDPAYAAKVRRFLDALRQGTDAAIADPNGAVSVMRQATSYKEPFLRASVPATLSLLRPPGGAPVGCMDAAAWRSYGEWMHRTGLLPGAVDGATLMTDAYLPGGC